MNSYFSVWAETKGWITFLFHSQLVSNIELAILTTISNFHQSQDGSFLALLKVSENLLKSILRLSSPFHVPVLHWGLCFMLYKLTQSASEAVTSAQLNLLSLEDSLFFVAVVVS